MKSIIAVLTLSLASIPIPARAQWAPDGAVVCGFAENQNRPAAVPDGVGGLIIVWEDFRFGSQSGSHTYAQRLDATGTQLWNVDGVRLCWFPSTESVPAIASDGDGGAIVAWNAPGRGGIYAQRVDADGSLQWGDHGLPLCTAPGGQSLAAVVSDGAGGALAIWRDNRSHEPDIFAQRVTGAGATLWGDNGVAVCAVAGVQHVPYVVADGVGGAIVAWADERGSYSDIYAQRMNPWGWPLWTTGGVPVCTAMWGQIGGALISDGGGAIITWSDYREGNSFGIYAQRVDAGGVPQWIENGVPVCTAREVQGVPVISRDGGAGAIIGWEVLLPGQSDVYAQRVSPEGTSLWSPDGIPLCSEPGYQSNVRMQSDGEGGAIAVWLDDRKGPGVTDLYAQRMRASGAPAWEQGGVAVCTAAGARWQPIVHADGAGGAISVWRDTRSAAGDIYAARLKANGWVVSGARDTRSPSPFFLMPNVPNPFQTATSFDLVLDVESSVVVDVFDVSGRRVRHFESIRAPAGPSTLAFDGLDQAGIPLASGAYFFRVTAGDRQLTRKIMVLR